MNKKVAIYILFVFICKQTLFSQENKVKSLFIYGFTKYIEWPNPQNFKEFSIGVLGNDTSLVEGLKNIANTKTFFGRPFKILNFKSISEIQPCHLLYVNRRSNFNIQEIYVAIQNNKTLLVTEEYPFNSSMINFIFIDQTQRFEVNESKIHAAGLKVSKELVALSTTQEEWQQHYNNLQIKLISEKENTEQQRAEIERLRKLQQQQQKEIEKAQYELREQEMNVYNQKLQLQSLLAENENQQALLKEKIRVLDMKDKEIREKEKKMLEQELNVLYQNEILTRQMKQIELQEQKIKKQQNVMQQNEMLIASKQKKLNISFIGLGLIALIAIAILKNAVDKQKANKVLAEKNRAIELQKQQIEEKNQAIMASIYYAKKIQEAILPSEEALQKLLRDYFVFNQPKDIVSGDFYWVHNSTHSNNTILAVADCTGHGVPGAFMSLIGHSLLNEIVIENKVEDSAEILNELKVGIIESLKQKGSDEEAKDGMDIALCVWDRKTNRIQFSGAHNPLYVIRNNTLQELKGDMQSIGFNRGANNKMFEKHYLDLKQDDLIYMFSDGFVDQKGGPNNKKFFYEPFRQLLLSNAHLPLKDQGEQLRIVFNNWKKNQLQMDDVCIFGAKLI